MCTNRSLSVLMATVPCEPGLAGILGAEGDGGGDDNWSYKTCKTPVKSSPLANQNPNSYR